MNFMCHKTNISSIKVCCLYHANLSFFYYHHLWYFTLLSPPLPNNHSADLNHLTLFTSNDIINSILEKVSYNTTLLRVSDLAWHKYSLDHCQLATKYNWGFVHTATMFDLSILQGFIWDHKCLRHTNHFHQFYIFCQTHRLVSVKEINNVTPNHANLITHWFSKVKNDIGT